MNITLNIGEEIVKKVRRIAIDKDTTVTVMLRGLPYLVGKGRRSGPATAYLPAR